MKKQNQLGMNPSTASHRLVKDLLFEYAVNIHEKRCYHCNKKMNRDTFSIEHKEPWLDSADPVGLYFDLENISFSHKSCNASAARRPTKRHNSAKERYAVRDAMREVPYDSKKRREKYLRTGN